MDQVVANELASGGLTDFLYTYLLGLVCRSSGLKYAWTISKTAFLCQKPTKGEEIRSLNECLLIEMRNVMLKTPLGSPQFGEGYIR
ncbi:uncharacterized protein N7500_008960 [Penicillium coprophilum]|uniref:uncharacterized protein n=1 Tax=Penicillium coprophilum TaxID=36646 RepID=UPI00238E0A96|nr:uncharacterized protein N7500_008960 [Penicillium coprophilum]KAJ5159309.1 hypothetical protein N7500_008960 [Penicillium coprophilum]